MREEDLKSLQKHSRSLDEAEWRKDRAGTVRCSPVSWRRRARLNSAVCSEGPSAGSLTVIREED
jgi:hypothetical protein